MKADDKKNCAWIRNVFRQAGFFFFCAQEQAYFLFGTAAAEIKDLTIKSEKLDEMWFIISLDESLKKS
ncbi:MAG: hypothetical protein LUI87_03790 [Lachnospiraceae bacterium]|nr:hypothetical protein [Lachnospiraceae bacterium]